MLLIEKLCKQYGKLTAVDNLSLEVDTGAIFGLVGPNGAEYSSCIYFQR